MKKDFESPENWYHTVGAHYLAVQIYFHLNQVGVMNYILDHAPVNSEEIAKELKLDQRLVTDLLLYIAHVDVVIEVNDKNEFQYTDFGQEVIKRYSRVENNKTTLNFHNVRVGGFSPIFNSMTEMLKMEKSYGKDIFRDGGAIEEGLYTISDRFVGAVHTAISRLNPSAIVELGTDTGLIWKAHEAAPNTPLFGLDKSEAVIKEAKQKLATSQSKAQVTWLQDNLYNVDQWASKIEPKDKVCFFSVHFHEFVKETKKDVAKAIEEMKRYFSGSHIIVLEQPMHSSSDKNKMSEALWLYSHSNVLIHHLINSGRILPIKEWIDLFQDSGAKLVDQRETGYLGYEALDFKL